MREILFRGKHKATGKWCEGNLNIDKQGVAIITPDDTPIGCYGQVDPNTVGQFTGLTDKNGTKIFEGDIVEFEDTGEDGFEYSEGFDFRNRAVVVWNNGRWELDEYASDNSGVADDMMYCHDDFISVFEFQSWVIGNIHDNPELMEMNDNE